MSIAALNQSDSMLALQGSPLRNPTSSPTFLAMTTVIYDEDRSAVPKRLQVLPDFVLELDLAILSWYRIFFDDPVIQTDEESFQALGVFAKVSNMVPNGPMYAKHSGLDIIVFLNKVVDILWSVCHIWSTSVCQI